MATRPAEKRPSLAKLLRMRAKKVFGLDRQIALGRTTGLSGPGLTDEPYSDFYASLKEEQQIREKIRASLECAICTDIMLDPVSLDCGHTFCLHCMATDYCRRKGDDIICCMCRDGTSKTVSISCSLRDVIDVAFPGEIRHRRDNLTPTDRLCIAKLLSAHKKSPLKEQIDQYRSYVPYVVSGLVIFFAWFFYPADDYSETAGHA